MYHTNLVQYKQIQLYCTPVFVHRRWCTAPAQLRTNAAPLPLGVLYGSCYVRLNPSLSLRLASSSCCFRLTRVLLVPLQVFSPRGFLRFVCAAPCAVLAPLLVLCLPRASFCVRLAPGSFCPLRVWVSQCLRWTSSASHVTSSRQIGDQFMLGTTAHTSIQYGGSRAARNSECKKFSSVTLL